MLSALTDIRCPYCHKLFFYLTPSGHGAAHIRCERCHLEFIVNHPLPVVILLRSASALLYERWGYSHAQAQVLLSPLTVYVLSDGHPVLLWDQVRTLAPPESLTAKETRDRA
jgi:uncharacterized protein YbaR (Trm112 family)